MAKSLFNWHNFEPKYCRSKNLNREWVGNKSQEAIDNIFTHLIYGTPGKSVKLSWPSLSKMSKISMCKKVLSFWAQWQSPLKPACTPIFGPYVVSLYMAAPNPSFAINRLWLKSTWCRRACRGGWSCSWELSRLYETQQPVFRWQPPAAHCLRPPPATSTSH